MNARSARRARTGPRHLTSLTLGLAAVAAVGFCTTVLLTLGVARPWR